MVCYLLWLLPPSRVALSAGHEATCCQSSHQRCKSQIVVRTCNCPRCNARFLHLLLLLFVDNVQLKIAHSGSPSIAKLSLGQVEPHSPDVVSPKALRLLGEGARPGSISNKVCLESKLCSTVKLFLGCKSFGICR